MPNINHVWENLNKRMDIIERLQDPELYVDAVDDAIAEIKRLRELTEWRPMTSAPRDGTPILVACGKYVYKVHWSDEARFEKFEEKPGWQLFDCPDGFYSIALEPDEPKAWLPLPQPLRETK